MARIASTGFELGAAETYTSTDFGSVPVTITTANPHTSLKSLAWNGAGRAIGWAFASQDYVGGGCWISHNGATSGNVALIFGFKTGSLFLTVRWNMTDNLIEIVNQASSVLASVSDSFMGTAGTYNHYGFSYGKAEFPADGWITLYVNGTEVLSARNASVPSIEGIRFGGTVSGNGWGSSAYMDDCYIDGDQPALDRPPSSNVFRVIRPNSDQSNQWQNINTLQANYLAIDDDVVDDDATYVWTSTTGNTDLFGMQDPGLAAGHSINSVTWYAVAKSTALPDWWTGALVAYQPIGAASYNDSLTDITGNGHDAVQTIVGKQPTHSAGGGWLFDGINDALGVGSLNAYHDYTVAIRYSGATRSGDYLFGSGTGAGDPFLYGQANAGGSRISGHWGDDNTNSGGIGPQSSGVIVVNSAGVYHNGTFDTGYPGGTTWVGAPGASTTNVMVIGARNLGIILSGYYAGSVQAFAMYDSVLTSLEISTLSSAMAALS